MTVQMLKLSPMVAELLHPTYDLSAPLTPDALMSYCSMRLRGLDEQVNVAFNKQKIANDDGKTLSDLQSKLWTPNQPVNTACNGGFEAALGEAKKMLDTAACIKDPATRAALEDKAKALLQKCQEGLNARAAANKVDPPDVGSFLTMLNEGASSGAIDGTLTNLCGAEATYDVSIADYKACTTDAVQNIQKDMNASTELSMISLQSVMSQRQSAVQLITNMVQALGDQTNKIVSNVGH